MTLEELIIKFKERRENGTVTHENNFDVNDFSLKLQSFFAAIKEK